MAVPSLIVPLSPHYLHRWGHWSALTMVLLTTPTLAGMDSGVKASNNVHMWHSVAFLSIITFWNIHHIPQEHSNICPILFRPKLEIVSVSLLLMI